MDWYNYYIGMADYVALKSKDVTKVGAVIVGPDREIRSTGFNGFARGIAEEGVPERWDRPAKYLWVEHAERNAVYNAARMGTPCKGCILVLNWYPIPCVDCTKAVIQSGIVGLVGPDRPFPQNRDWNFDVAKQMLNEARINVQIV